MSLRRGKSLLGICVIAGLASLTSCGGVASLRNTQQLSNAGASFVSQVFRITTADLPIASVQKPYSASVAATAGATPYTWSMSSGSLPPGLRLDPSTGTISGTPTAAGWSGLFTIQVADKSGKTAALSYSMLVMPALDQYGGRLDLSCGSANGAFSTQKIGNRWWLCDPLGNAYFMQAMGGMGMPDDGCDNSTGQCNNYQIVAKQKYGDLDVTWGPQQVRRVQSWGFNGIGQLSVGWVMPSSSDSRWPGDHTQPAKLPMIYENQSSSYATVNLNNLAGQPTKNMMQGLNAHYTGWRAALIDVFDPNYKQWVNAQFATFTDAALSSPWTVGALIDDIDFFWGLGGGPDFHTSPPGHNSDHIGYMVMITSPIQTFNNGTGLYRSLPQLYVDPKVYAKVASATPPASCSIQTPCSLRDYLYKRYNGNISTLNAAWGSNYTTFDSAGIQVSGELIGTGDGATKVFSHTLAQTPISPLSVLFKINSSVQGGDCPWWNGGCNQITPNMGSISGPSGTTIATGTTVWLSDNPCGTPGSNSNAPHAAFSAQIVLHFGQGGGVGSPSRQTAENCPATSGDSIVAPPDPTGGLATGYDVYMQCKLYDSATPAFGCVGNQNPVNPPTLQASNVPFSQNWAVPSTGLTTMGAQVPGPPSYINYSNGQVQITFSTAPASGQAITADYVANGWMYGTGLMDEDGRNTPWLGTNSMCLSAQTACDGVDFPRPNANTTLAQDLDAWVAQFSGQYFGTIRTALKTKYPKLLYLGCDTLGSWGSPPRSQILQGAAPFVDAVFPGILYTQAQVDYTAQNLGDKPMIAGFILAATADSSLWRYPGQSVGIWDIAPQENRGQRYLNDIQLAQNMQATPTGSYPFIATNWWGLVDFWNEKTDWGLVSLNDNPYDGKSATIVARTDAWGYSTGGEERNYGDSIDIIRHASSLWWSLH
jgi:Putative Ig domain